MDHRTTLWLDSITETLAEARAVLACFGVDHPDLVARIEAAMDEARALKIAARVP
jgi:hypothetical protein